MRSGSKPLSLFSPDFIVISHCRPSNSVLMSTQLLGWELTVALSFVTWTLWFDLDFWVWQDATWSEDRNLHSRTENQAWCVTGAYAKFNGGQSFSNKRHAGTAPEVAGRAGASATPISGESSLLDWWAGLVEVCLYDSQSIFWGTQAKVRIE